jgi:hypothetical protein
VCVACRVYVQVSMLEIYNEAVHDLLAPYGPEGSAGVVRSLDVSGLGTSLEATFLEEEGSIRALLVWLLRVMDTWAHAWGAVGKLRRVVGSDQRTTPRPRQPSRSPCAKPQAPAAFLDDDLPAASLDAAAAHHRSPPLPRLQARASCRRAWTACPASRGGRFGAAGRGGCVEER